MKTRSSLVGALLAVALFFKVAIASADSILWTGAASDGRWETGANWTNITAGGAGQIPGATDAVFFFDTPATLVSLSSLQTVQGLFFGGTNANYALQIAAPGWLDVRGTLRAGTLQDPGSAVQRTVTVSGYAMTVSNAAANLVLNQGQWSANGSHVTLDLQGLDLFAVDVNGMGIGSVHYENAVAQRNAGSLYLAKTNLVVLRHALSRELCLTNPAVTNALELVYVGAGNHANVRSFLYLGISNAFYVDNMGFGKSKASSAAAATMRFNPNFLGYQPVARFRGLGGEIARVTWWALGDMADFGSSAQFAVGTNDFTGGYVDALVDVMSLGRDTSGSQTGTGARWNLGVLAYDQGVFDVNLLIAGNQSLGGSGNATPNVGYVLLSGPQALLRINEELRLAHTAVDSTSAQGTFGFVQVDGGALYANRVTVGRHTRSNAVIRVVNGGRLYVTNTVASASKPLMRLEMSDAALGLTVLGVAPVVWVTNLVTGGSQNTVDILGSITFDTYPARVPLIRYEQLGGTGFNFVLGQTPGNLPGAYLTNQPATSSIELVIPTDPRPFITDPPDGFAGPEGSTVRLTVSASGVSPLIYLWLKDGQMLAEDGRNTGTQTATLTILNARLQDSGFYQVVISNVYGVVTSSPAPVTISAGHVAPVITGLADLPVLQGRTATFAPSVAGVPTPWVQWYKDGMPIPGANATSLSIDDCSYPRDEGLYAIVATNVAGVASNVAVLTVIVPPTILTGPQSVTAPVGTSISLTVVASGRPNLSYQWYKGTSPVAGGTRATLDLANLQPSEAGLYRVEVSNIGGSVWSDPISVTVTSTQVQWTQVSPDDQPHVCTDTLLRVWFNSTNIVLGTGRLWICDTWTNVVETIDLSLNHPNQAQVRTIGGANYYAYPVLVRGNMATIYPRAGVFKTNTTYFVLMETGFFRDSLGASVVGISDPQVWRFTTKAVLPDPWSTSEVVVAADGSGDFATVQGAIDWIPIQAGIPYTVRIRKGVYEEINRVPSGKNQITFIGEGWRESVLTYANNNTFQMGLASTATRCMFFAGGNDLVFKNLTFSNSTPQGGSQAEAIRVQGARILFDHCSFYSYQDTILINSALSSAGFFNKCLVAGDVDFIWGSGIGYFTNCEIRALRRANNAAGVYTQPRTDAGSFGFVFVDCRVTASSADLVNWSLGRDGGNSYPYGNVAWINCWLDRHISPAGWTDGGLTDKSTLRFWEYQSMDLSGSNPVPVDQRVPWSRQLTPAEAAVLRDASVVFAPVNWTPGLAAYVAASPTNRVLQTGETLVLAAAVGGVPEPICQWYKDGRPLPGASGAILVIPNVGVEHAGMYTLRVVNVYGDDASSPAVVTVQPNTPLALAAPVRMPDGTVVLQFSGPTGSAYRLWASSDLAIGPVTQSWILISSGTFGAEAVLFHDTTASAHRQRFYVLTSP